MSNEAQPTQPADLLNVQIDGTWHTFPKGTRLIEACSLAGKFVPRYCYHARLSAPGNCRMCMVQLGMPRLDAERKPELGADGKPLHNWGPRPQISCAQEVSEGLGVRTDSPVVKEARESVMEFLLVNHPLDCPICDQAGECRLQEFAVDHGRANARTLEAKTKKPKRVAVGPRITLDNERCILCTRCVRFMREVAKDDVLGIVDRGGQNRIATAPGRVLESNYSLNTVDLCPVGALTANDFRFKMRTWFLKETKSVCTGCATGCNTVIGSRENVIYRQMPRENGAVNQTWMCDAGRLGFHATQSAERLTTPVVKGGGKGGEEAGGVGKEADWNTALSAAAAALNAHESGEIAMIVSGAMTNEELFLAAQIAKALGLDAKNTARVGFLPRNGEGDYFLLSVDRLPNSAGAKLQGFAALNTETVLADVRSGKIKTVLALGEDLAAAGFSSEDLQKLDQLIVLATLPSITTNAAAANVVLLPGASFAEKRGSLVNKTGRLQRLNPAVDVPGLARDDWEILAALLAQIPAGNRSNYNGAGGSSSADAPAYTTFEAVFAALTAATPAFAVGDSGAENKPLTFATIGDLGLQLSI